jgi:hypothetical protein
MGDEADADWQDGLVEWGREDAAPKCDKCGGTGWLDAIGPKADGSYITSRPCKCGAYKGLRW